MAQRRVHYEQAFEQYLREHGIPYVAVNEARKALVAASRRGTPRADRGRSDVPGGAEGIGAIPEDGEPSVRASAGMPGAAGTSPVVRPGADGRGTPAADHEGEVPIGSGRQEDEAAPSPGTAGPDGPGRKGGPGGGGGRTAAADVEADLGANVGSRSRPAERACATPRAGPAEPVGAGRCPPDDGPEEGGSGESGELAALKSFDFVVYSGDPARPNLLVDVKGRKCGRRRRRASAAGGARPGTTGCGAHPIVGPGIPGRLGSDRLRTSVGDDGRPRDRTVPSRRRTAAAPIPDGMRTGRLDGLEDLPVEKVERSGVGKGPR